MSFGVADEPWIPILDASGASRELGLLEVLAQAHELRAISHSLPIVECGIYRLLIAFVLDIFPLQGTPDWKLLWDACRFDEALLRVYFERHCGRLDLFGEKYPFLQSADAEGDDKPIAGLLPIVPSGTNATHFYHHGESEFAVAPAVAAQLLTTIAAFMTAGGAGLSPSINGAPPWYVLLQGNNLFQTLLLNTLVLRSNLNHCKGEEIPAWRSDETVQKEDRAQASLLQSLTWQPRRLLLRPHLASEGKGVCTISGRESRVLVGRMKFSAGWSTRFEWRDPQAAYRVTKDSVTIVRPREGRALWRDAGALMFTRHGQGSTVEFERPAVISQYERFVNDAFEDRDVPLRLTGYGMRTDMKMKVFEWHREELQLPALLLWKSHFHGLTESAMQLAENVAWTLGTAIKKTYPRDGKGNNKAFDALIARAQGEFWAQLRPPFVDEYLPRIAGLEEDEDGTKLNTVTAEWQSALSQVARRVLDASISGLDTDGEAIKRQIEARRFFDIRLWALLHPIEAEKKRKAKGEKA